MILFERSYHFSASHLYWRNGWSEEQNREVFGKCSIRPAHGHNYRLTVRVRGEVDPTTGFLVNLVELDRIVRQAIVERLDHRHINDVLPEFGPHGRIPTTENLVLWMVAELDSELAGQTDCSLQELRLQEEDRIAALWRREADPSGE